MDTSKAKQALDFVRRAAPGCKNATELHNIFFGIGGEFGKLFPTRAEREAFMQTAEYREIVEIRESLEESWTEASA